MSFFLSYIAYGFFYRILEFLRHWYVKSGKIYSDKILNWLNKIDYYLAWKITLKHFFEPLYGDYTFWGRLLGVSFRTVRLLLGGMIYVVIFAFVLGGYVAWLALPIYLFYLVFKT